MESFKRKIMEHEVELIKHSNVYRVFVDDREIGEVHIKSEGWIIAKEWIEDNFRAKDDFGGVF